MAPQVPTWDVRVGQIMENHRAASAEQLALAGKQGVFDGPVVFDQ